MYQKWRDLSFLHFAIDPQDLRSLIPEELQIDTFPDATGQERAWVGLIPFWMTGVRPRFIPPIPGLHTFPETNLRTYVHHKGKRPGVWFFSLEAANRLACATARLTFGLPYFWAKMQVTKRDKTCSYTSYRRDAQDVGCNVVTSVGNDLPPAELNTLEFFLVERYLLYSKFRGKLYTGQVHHHPYPIASASIESCDQTLTRASNVPDRPWIHCLFSPGVDVEIFGVQQVEN